MGRKRKVREEVRTTPMNNTGYVDLPISAKFWQKRRVPNNIMPKSIETSIGKKYIDASTQEQLDEWTAEVEALNLPRTTRETFMPIFPFTMHSDPSIDVYDDEDIHHEYAMLYGDARHFVNDSSVYLIGKEGVLAPNSWDDLSKILTENQKAEYQVVQVPVERNLLANSETESVHVSGFTKLDVSAAFRKESI